MLTTEVGPGSTSWFITPLLNLPNTSYLVIETLCYRRPCQLEVNGRLDIRYRAYIQIVLLFGKRLRLN